MDYTFREIEKKWQKQWAKDKVFRPSDDRSKPKFYVLDMFPYPSGSGLHVGHPLGYIASDIISRYKRLKGFNVLHPMGYDAFGLPAEQYAVQTGQHPAVTTEQNIKRYREQLDNMGFSFDWDREVRTSDPSFYRWTQWIFIQLYNSWYNPESDKAEPISTLLPQLEKPLEGIPFSAMSEQEQSALLMNYRLAYLSETMVNWCPGLGTVLANEEVKDGISERGGYPVERKLMKQWSLRITAYAERLLQGLEVIDWSESIKEAQRNWIAKSVGATFAFYTNHPEPKQIQVFSTRPDTLFGCSFLVLSPEHPLVAELTTAAQQTEVQVYIDRTKKRTERERMADTKTVSGAFTGGFAVHPFNGKNIPVWISDYVLAGYGTGAIMAVPAHDARDFAFAKKFALPIVQVVAGGDLEKEAFESKEGTLINSDFLDGLSVKEATQLAISKIEEKGMGKGTVNYRLRDAIFSRQRYWGEPFPVFYKDGQPYMVDEKELPVQLPSIDKYLPTEKGEPPLARATNWTTRAGFTPDYNTMPGWAGSSWYFLRYMDPQNEKTFVSREAADYWQQVDLYIGGAEHATGHLLYFRFWTKFLHDLGYISIDEPAKKLVNQGMILGRSLFLWQGFYENTADSNETTLRICSAGKIPEEFSENGKSYKNIGKMHYRIMIQFADARDRLSRSNFSELMKHETIFNDVDLDCHVRWEKDDAGVEFIQLTPEVEKMSKSKFNVVNPDDIIDKYGADTLRMYEMFLGPLDQHKPWNTNGIEGVSKFLRKFWNLFHQGGGEKSFLVSDEAPSKGELKILHKMIRKAEEDMEKFAFNTTVSAFMITVNELADLKCNKRAILEPLCIVLEPLAPHITEELWHELGHAETVNYASYPVWNQDFITEDAFDYPISINGKTKCKLNLPLSMTKEEVEQVVRASEEVAKFLNDASPKKVIVVHGRIVNLVL